MQFFILSQLLVLIALHRYIPFKSIVSLGVNSKQISFVHRFAAFSGCIRAPGRKVRRAHSFLLEIGLSPGHLPALLRSTRRVCLCITTCRPHSVFPPLLPARREQSRDDGNQSLKRALSLLLVCISLPCPRPAFQ